MKKLLFAALLAAESLVFAAGTVQVSVSGPLGQTQNYVAAFTWVGDAANGSVPVTVAPVGPVAQGFLIFGAEFVPGSPSPSTNYSVAINDFAGVDQLGGAGANLSATVPSGANASANAQPINGIFSLVITGQAVANARGTVYVYYGAVNSTTLAGRTSGTALGVAGGDLVGAYPNPFLITTGITAATYGSATQTPQCTFDVKGRATTCTNVTTAPTNAAGGDLTGNYPNPTLVTTAATPGSFGSASQTPTFTVDTKGRLTASGQTASIPTNAAGGDLTGNYPNPTLVTTAATPGSFGSAAQCATYTVDAKGRLTASGQTACIPTNAAGGDLTGNFPNPTLVTSGVGAGTYGSSTQVPQFTVDAKGRLTLAANVSISGGGSAFIYDNRTYNFSPQTPAGSLTATVLATVSLAPCPVGVNGTDTKHYLRVATVGTPESVLITGGSCTSGAGSGTVQFTPTLSHANGYTLASSTTGVEEAYQVAKAAAVPATIGVIGNATFTSSMSIDVSNITLRGFQGVILCNLDASVTFNCVDVNTSLSGFNTTNVTVNLPFANRSTTTTRSITVSNNTGFTVGKMAQITYNDGTYDVEQLSPITVVVGNVVTVADPIVVPAISSQANTIYNYTFPLQNVRILELTVDCTGTAAGVTQVVGVSIQNAMDSLVSDVGVTNCSQGSISGGFNANQGYNNTFHNIRSRNSGGSGLFAVSFTRQSSANVSDVISEGNQLTPPGAFGIGISQSVLGNFTNLTAQGNYSRQIKLGTAGWNKFSNINASGATNATGFGFTVGSYRNIVTNLTTLLNLSGVGNGVGIWFSDQDNEFNTIYNAQTSNNANAEVSVGPTDVNNAIYGLSVNAWTGNNTLFQPGGGGSLEMHQAGGNPHNYMAGCTGVATASQTLFIVIPGGACTNTNAVGASFTVPSMGLVHNLRVHATGAGVNASSGLFTIGILGGAIPGVTCTIGTGTDCSDTTNWFPVQANQSLYVRFTTQAAETLSNINVSFEY